jgi:hypothetical protein
MQTTEQPDSYIGPRPSPARVWAPFVVVLCAVLALGNVLMLALNLVERGYQEQRASGVAPALSHIRETLDSLHTIGEFTSWLSLAFVVVAVIWSVKRRTKTRLAADGERGVEAHLRSVNPALYILFWCALGASFLLTIQGRSVVHVGMTPADFVDYRTYLAAANAARAVMWGSLAVLVVLATRRQDRREAATADQVAWRAPVDASWRRQVALDGFGSKTWHKVAIGLLIGLTAMFAALIAAAELA